jgi:hypothetical protein
LNKLEYPLAEGPKQVYRYLTVIFVIIIIEKIMELARLAEDITISYCLP